MDRITANPAFLFGAAILLIMPFATSKKKQGDDWKQDVKLEVNDDKWAGGNGSVCPVFAVSARRLK